MTGRSGNEIELVATEDGVQICGRSNALSDGVCAAGVGNRSGEVLLAVEPEGSSFDDDLLPAAELCNKSAGESGLLLKNTARVPASASLNQDGAPRYVTDACPAKPLLHSGTLCAAM